MKMTSVTDIYFIIQLITNFFITKKHLVIFNLISLCDAFGSKKSRILDNILNILIWFNL